MSKKVAKTAKGVSAPITYTVSAPSPNTHLFHITLRVQSPAQKQELSLPVWIPGSYLVREFARHLQNLQAQQDGRSCAVKQLDKHRWQVQCVAGKPLEVRYQVYAHDNSVRTAWLDGQRGFFNATSLCLMVQGQTREVHHIRIAPPTAVIGQAWKLATALQAVDTDKQGFGVYGAAHYDVLADSPVEMGDFWSGAFTAYGVPHRFVIANPPPALDGERLLQDAQRICETAMQFWHGQASKQIRKQLPFGHYVFMLNAVADGYGGLEHAYGTALIAARKTLPLVGQKPDDDYVNLLGLISHEYFHAWNVKRLKPAEFLPYDYSRENYTELLWFFEGLTSYYDDLLLLRAGCIDTDGYLRRLQKNIDNVFNTPGRAQHSVAQASFEAWTKFYRPDANTANVTVSYYTKGALVCLCLDLTLQREGKTTLNAVVRELYQRCYAADVQAGKAPKGLTEKDVLAVLQELGGRSFAKEIRAWVHGTKELPVEQLLKQLSAQTGITATKQKAGLQQQWGLRCKTENGSIHVQTVLRDSAAEASGLAAGDEWLGIELPALSAQKTNKQASVMSKASAWRVSSLEEVHANLPPAHLHAALAEAARKAAAHEATNQAGRYATKGAPYITALVARDRRLLRLPLVLPISSRGSLKLQQQTNHQTNVQTAKQANKKGKQKACWPWV